MNKPNKNPNENINVIDVDAGTLLLIVSALFLVPLLLTGFLSH
ncbi:conserved hypothetical protein [Hyella patelloides LEGE 07179]|uniref:Uncharacterized protein n=1 Tax=Hyella patelloides LEGE 07179 TaxID=945734 RepID=A0A563W1E2_9CYAN|nr:hypothetical protein [Hyella patelloides]VEP17508.1 conserved hypothetical protein [Hyella patelloides LEGE 07179]